jgi:protein-disulfide isomerase
MAKDDEEDRRERESLDENENSTIGDDDDDDGQREAGAAAEVGEGEGDEQEEGEDEDDEDDDDDGNAEDAPRADEAKKKRKRDDAKVVAANAKAVEKPKSKLIGNIVFAVAFLAVLGVGYLAGQQVKRFFRDPAEIVTGDRYSVKLRGDEPQLGPDDALVTIIQYSDFQCPYCSKAAGPLVAEVERAGDVRLIFKHYPLPMHPKALPAAYAAWAAHQQGKFWEMHDFLYEKKGDLRELPAKIEQLGIDKEKFTTDLESQAAKDSVDDDHLSGGRVGIGSTPSFLVNGHNYAGSRDRDFWRDVIAAERTIAKELVATGVAREKVYEKLMADALTSRGGGGAVGGKPSERPAKGQRRKGEAHSDRVYAVPTDGRPQRGPDDALVTIVEFADYHCPYCAKADLTMEHVLEKFGDDVRVVFRQRPLAMHKQAKPAAKAAMAAGRQDKYWEMHALLFKRRTGDLDGFKVLAEEIGLDVDQFARDYDDPAIEDHIAEDEGVALKFGIVSTPAFFINGKYIRGALGPEVFDEMVEAAIADAKKAGVDGKAVYEEILRTGEKEVSD